MPKPKNRLILAAIAALVAELVVPAFSDIAQAVPSPQFTQARVRPDADKALAKPGLLAGYDYRLDR